MDFVLEGDDLAALNWCWNMGPSPHLGTSILVEVEKSHQLGGEKTTSVLGFPSGADSSPWGEIPEELSCGTVVLGMDTVLDICGQEG